MLSEKKRIGSAFIGNHINNIKNSGNYRIQPLNSVDYNNKRVTGYTESEKLNLYASLSNEYLQNNDITTAILTQQNREYLIRAVKKRLSERYKGDQTISDLLIAGSVNSASTFILNGMDLHSDSPAFSTVASMTSILEMINDQIITKALKYVISQVTSQSVIGKNIDINLIRDNTLTRGIYAAPPIFPRNLPYAIPHKKVNDINGMNSSANYIFAISNS